MKKTFPVRNCQITVTKRDKTLKSPTSFLIVIQQYKLINMIGINIPQ